MHSTEWIKSLKEGDRVIKVCLNFTKTVKTIAEVEKITPKGFIKISGCVALFNPNTGEIRSDVDCWIEEATPDKIKEINNQNFIRSVLNEVRSIHELSFEQAVELYNVFKKWGTQN